MYNVKELGQVFTPDFIVAEMLQLRKNYGKILEPSSGAGAFANNIPDCISVEIDKKYCNNGTLNIDFFDYPVSEKFETIIGNPPYVRYQDILSDTKKKIKSNLFDERTNLYLFFMEKCINHLAENGELIFITPREFLKATSSMKLNNFIYEHGTITDLIDLGDKKIFNGFTPNCVIFRFEKNNFSRQTNLHQRFIFNNGQLLFTNNDYSVVLKDIFSVKVGAVSGNDKIFTNNEYGNADFVNSTTAKTGKIRKMIFNINIPYLEQYKDILLERGIRKFSENDWWQWGRLHHISEQKRIYVNCKTRNKNPFFVHQCKNYDGSVLALFPNNQALDENELCEKLNAVNWYELGFVCDGRYIFSQKSLENTLLPDSFLEYINKENLF
jgi:adenine-specific DNA-methyltransferase